MDCSARLLHAIRTSSTRLYDDILQVIPYLWMFSYFIYLHMLVHNVVSKCEKREKSEV